jgi:hypothetical protein
MKLFNESGITTIQQLREMPLENLAAVTSIGTHYARLIKNSVCEYDEKEGGKRPPGIVSDKEKEVETIDREMKRKIGKLQKNLNRINENLKPLWNKKYLGLYVDFKKQFKKLKARLKVLIEKKAVISKKEKKNIVAKSGTLISHLKKVGKKPKKKTYKKITREIRSFSRYVRDL